MSRVILISVILTVAFSIFFPTSKYSSLYDTYRWMPKEAFVSGGCPDDKVVALLVDAGRVYVCAGSAADAIEYVNEGLLRYRVFDSSVRYLGFFSVSFVILFFSFKYDWGESSLRSRMAVSFYSVVVFFLIVLPAQGFFLLMLLKGGSSADDAGAFALIAALGLAYFVASRVRRWLLVFMKTTN